MSVSRPALRYHGGKFRLAPWPTWWLKLGLTQS